MRIAAISDIHSNVYALHAVLEDIAKRQVDIVVNLGDILYGPIAPLATYELLLQHPLITIRGNQDRQIYQATAQELEMNPTLQFILQQLGDAPLRWLQTLPASLQLTPEVFICHGTPDDDLIYLLEDVQQGHAVIRSDAEIMQLLKSQRAEVVLCGHTHLPRTATTSSGQLIVNPGSVGLPAYTDDFPVAHAIENYSPHARYAIIEQQPQGWQVEQIAVAYDYAQAATAALRQGRADWARFLSSGRR